MGELEQQPGGACSPTATFNTPGDALAGLLLLLRLLQSPTAVHLPEGTLLYFRRSWQVPQPLVAAGAPAAEGGAQAVTITTNWASGRYIGHVLHGKQASDLSAVEPATSLQSAQDATPRPQDPTMPAAGR